MLYFISSNKGKIDSARHSLSLYGIEIETKNVPVDEIQGDSVETIALDKAEKVFSIIKQPLISTDHGWLIHGLNGFPGPYMKYMNDWLTPENFLDLTRNLEDRRITLQEVVVYKDESHTKLFRFDHSGVLLKEARGDNYYPAMMLASFHDGLSVAEAVNKGKNPHESSELWQEFADWYKTEVISKSSPEPSR